MGDFKALQRRAPRAASRLPLRQVASCDPNVRYGSNADICGAKRRVRSTHESGHRA